MDVNFSQSKAKNFDLYLSILIILFEISPSPDRGESLPPLTKWPSTRQIADKLGVSIYKARLLLLDLVNCNFALVSDGSVNNSLRWYPVHKTMKQKTQMMENIAEQTPHPQS